MHRVSSSVSEPSDIMLNSVTSDQDLPSMLTSYSAPGSANPSDRLSLTNKDKVLLPPLVMNNNANISTKPTGIAIFPVSQENQPLHSAMNKSPLLSNQGNILTYEQCKNTINTLIRTELSNDVIHHLSSWNLDIFPLSDHEMMVLTSKIMNCYDFLDTYNISLEKWYLFMLNVQHQMSSHMNPYHNFRHVMDIFQACHVFLQQFEGKHVLQSIDIFCIFLSALGHDLDHPGLNNMYQINAITPVAIRYNDVSVLENHHCCRAFELFFHPDIDIFASLDKETIRYVRKAIIKAILATDMVHHFSIKAELESTLISKTMLVASMYTDAHHVPITSARRTGSSSSINGRKESLSSTDTNGPVSKRLHVSNASRPSFSSAVDTTFTEKERLLWISLLVHAADISNPGKPWRVSKIWSDNVISEFFHQGDVEKHEHLPISMNCDRDTCIQDEISINFVDFIVAPYFIALTKALPNFHVVCQHIHDNRMRWHEMLMSRLSSAPGSEEVINKWQLRLQQSKESMEAYINIAED